MELKKLDAAAQAALPVPPERFGAPRAVQGGKVCAAGAFVHIVSGGRFKRFPARQEALTVREGSGYIKWARGELPFRAGECVLAEGLEEYDLYGEGEFLVTILK